MLKFDEELKKYDYILNVNDIEKEMATEDMSDVMDIIKAYTLQNKDEMFKENHMNGAI